MTETISIDGTAETPTKLDATARDHTIVMDEPAEFGGEDVAPNPLETLLASLAGCLNVTLHHIASERGIEVEDLSMTVEGEIDLDPLLLGDDGPAGFQEVSVVLSLRTDVGDDAEQDLIEATSRRCPVSATLRDGCSFDIRRAGE